MAAPTLCLNPRLFSCIPSWPRRLSIRSLSLPSISANLSSCLLSWPISLSLCLSAAYHGHVASVSVSLCHNGHAASCLLSWPISLLAFCLGQTLFLQSTMALISFSHSIKAPSPLSWPFSLLVVYSGRLFAFCQGHAATSPLSLSLCGLSWPCCLSLSASISIYLLHVKPHPLHGQRSAKQRSAKPRLCLCLFVCGPSWPRRLSLSASISVSLSSTCKASSLHGQRSAKQRSAKPHPLKCKRKASPLSLSLCGLSWPRRLSLSALCLCLFVVYHGHAASLSASICLSAFYMQSLTPSRAKECQAKKCKASPP